VTAPPTIAGADWLERPTTQRVLAALRTGGYEARVVGGAVRNTLLGLAVSDIDIATPARPEDVVRLAQASGLGTVATGLKHGTVTVIADHHPFEVTTLRLDVETDGRHATVAFTDDWTVDAARRDFTINALYADADGRVYDPVGGYPDILARRVRFIGEATARIREDYLRILRFFRFFATYETVPVPDAEGYAACIREQAGLDRISAERIRVELLKLVVGPNAPSAVSAIAEAGILTRVTGVAPRPAVRDRLARIERALGRAPDAVLQLAALLIAVEEDAERLGQRLRLSGAERQQMIEAAAAARDPLAPTDEAAARRVLYRLGFERFERRVLVAWAAGAGRPYDQDLAQLIALPKRWQAPRFPLDGAALLARGLSRGPRIGEVLRAVEAWWVAADFPDDASLLAERLEIELARPAG
jgi:poly(A) polymerase